MVLLQDHLLGGKPGDGSSSNVSLFKGFVKFSDEVWVSSQDHCSSCINGILAEGSGPSKGRSFGHVG